MSDTSTFLKFNIISAGLTCEINSFQSGAYNEAERLWLKLRALPDSRDELILSSGEDVCDLDVHLYFVNTLPLEMNAGLSSTEVGYLVHTQHIGDKTPFIHGELAWLNSPLPIYLINSSLSQTILLEFHLGQLENSRWGMNKKCRLPIVGASIEMTSMTME
ncbi:MAG: hypothetical protein AB1722_06100 [Pseudomonadota bacterium]